MWLLLCADDNYARPLAVALHSALSTIGPHEHVHSMIVLDSVSDANRRRLAHVADRHSANVTWVDARALETRGLRGNRHVTASTYLRLFVDQVVPEGAQRVLFVDADVLVRKDLSHLLDLDLEGKTVAAARDMVIADSDHPYSGSLTSGDRAPYFNAGVLLIDHARWRRLGLGEQLRNYARARPGHGNFDQDALNDLLRDEWLELDGTWNVQGSLLLLHEHPRGRWVEEMRRRRSTLLADPAIVHFSGSIKPWQASSRHPFTGEWRDSLRKSGWYTTPEYLAWRLPLLAKSAVIEALVRSGRRPARELLDG
jgi:lipopolysaccharide biosynthesis glycosyltransferase